ncbi:MAG: hypothetical protein OXF46_08875, partial [Rhodobacteraceae bacterium]|nr:hypothetical protein [Paracoccaceae bacterium]
MPIIGSSRQFKMRINTIIVKDGPKIRTKWAQFFLPMTLIKSHLITASLTIFLGFVLVTSGLSQEKNTWIELSVTEGYIEALATANVLGQEIDSVGIVDTYEDTYAVVSGPFDLTTARERLELIYVSSY